MVPRNSVSKPPSIFTNFEIPTTCYQLQSQSTVKFFDLCLFSFVSYGNFLTKYRAQKIAQFLAQLGKLDVYCERAIDVYVECRSFKTTPKSQIDVYVDSTLAVYVEFLKINTFYGILKKIWTVNDFFFSVKTFLLCLTLLESKKIL